MRIRNRRAALADLANLRAFIASSNPQAAKRLIGEIRGRNGKRANFPNKDRTGPVAGKREIVVAKYGDIGRCRIEASEIAIVAVFHAAQDIPGGG